MTTYHYSVNIINSTGDVVNSFSSSNEIPYLEYESCLQLDIDTNVYGEDAAYPLITNVGEQ